MLGIFQKRIRKKRKNYLVANRPELRAMNINVDEIDNSLLRNGTIDILNINECLGKFFKRKKFEYSISLFIKDRNLKFGIIASNLKLYATSSAFDIYYLYELLHKKKLPGGMYSYVQNEVYFDGYTSINVHGHPDDEEVSIFDILSTRKTIKISKNLRMDGFKEFIIGPNISYKFYPKYSVYSSMNLSALTYELSFETILKEAKKLWEKLGDDAALEFSIDDIIRKLKINPS